MQTISSVLHIKNIERLIFVGKLLRDGVVNTRKDHACHGCSELIQTGTQVYTQTIIDDGRIYTIYMCEKCRHWCNSNKCNDCIASEDAFQGYIGECMREKGAV